MKTKLEKSTIYRFKYGKMSPEKPFKVKELLVRNTSNHILNNKRAVKTPQGKGDVRKSRFGLKKNDTKLPDMVVEMASEDHNYELYMDHLLNYDSPPVTETPEVKKKKKKRLIKIKHPEIVEELEPDVPKFAYLKRADAKVSQ